MMIFVMVNPAVKTTIHPQEFKMNLKKASK